MTNSTNTTGNLTSDPHGTTEAQHSYGSEGLHVDSAVILFLFGSCAVGGKFLKVDSHLNS